VKTLDIWDEMMALERRFDDVMRDFLGPKARTSFPLLPTGVRKPFIPAADILTRDNDIVFRIELPGIDPEKDVTVVVEDDELVIRGERKYTHETKEKDYYRMETAYGAFERRFPLAEEVDEDKIEAAYKDGVLEVTIPAVEGLLEAKKKKVIPVTK